MVHPRVTKALNPQRKKFSLAQIRAGFGGKRRQSALLSTRKAAHKHRARPKATPKTKRRASAKAHNPKPKTVRRPTAAYAKTKRRAKAKARNPGPYLLTMSPVGMNPTTVRKKRRVTTMAKTKRVASAKSRSGKRTPTRRGPARKSNTHRKRSRNPFGESTNTTIKTGFGVFLGFSAAKKVPPMLGATANSSPFMSLVTTGAVALLAAWAAKRFAAGPLATGVLWGGAAGVINVAWNAWAPSSIAGYAGVGDFVPGGFPVPQIPVRYLPMGGGAVPNPANQSQVNLGAWGAAF